MRYVTALSSKFSLNLTTEELCESKQELYKKAICYLLLIQLSRRAIVKKAVNDAISAIMMYQYVIDHGR